MQQCPCPVCPLIAYRKNINPSRVFVENTNFEGDKFESRCYVPLNMPTKLTKSFNTLMLYARNNVELPFEHALTLDYGNIVICVAHYKLEHWGISVLQRPHKEHISTPVEDIRKMI